MIFPQTSCRAIYFSSYSFRFPESVFIYGGFENTASTSNPRVELFNKTLGLDAYPDSKKPSSATLITAMNKMGTTPENTAGLGDQLLTDTLAVHRLGMISIIVPPIKDKSNAFFKFKRRLERRYIRKYRKLHGITPKKDSLSERTWK